MYKIPLAILLLGLSSTITQSASAETFSQHVKSLKPEALARGISARTFNIATKGLTPNPKIGKLTRKQPELVNPIGNYISRRTKGSMIKTGRRKTANLKQTLRRLERTYGVDPYVVAAIWGMETGYGANIGKSNVFRELTTLSWKRYRKDFFRNEFFDALAILQKEKFPVKSMVSSWAGAMGQTQFIPSSFRKFAVDFNKDGKRDLWRTKGDALASTANYLAQKGWVRGQPWGFAVNLPAKLPRTALTRAWHDWRRLGIRPLNGKSFPKSGKATLFFPAGAEGPAFLISSNYEVIRDYNSSDSYSLSVSMIADRLRGGRHIALKWPTGKTLNKSERMKVQSLLAKKGYKVPNRTGRIIKGVRTAIRDFQLSISVVADGYPDKRLLKQLGR